MEAGTSSGTSAASDAATGSALVAACNAAGSPYHGGNKPFAAEDFCTLFLDICSTYLVSAEMTALGTQSACEATYAGWTMTQQVCRTDHLCNAAGGTADENPHCYHAQGYSSATAAGGPCP